MQEQGSLFSTDDAGLTKVHNVCTSGSTVPAFVNEFWTAKQRQSSSIHEVSYRACFKAHLPRFFIELLTREGDVVYDPFGGRGTTAIEAGLLGRRAISNDVNPLSDILARPRFFPPDVPDVAARLKMVSRDGSRKADIDLSMFFHPDTEAEIVALRGYLAKRRADGNEDCIDRWIRMVATNRLTGHSAGFFSVYTLPPNQAVTPDRQKRINEKMGQKPEYRNTSQIILRKTRSLLKDLSHEDRARLRQCGGDAVFLCCDTRETHQIPDDSVCLTVTSPPFLDVVQYADDNWLRCWFNGTRAESVAGRITMCRTIEDWREFIGAVFKELHRITQPGGWVAFEVGEVKAGRVKLEEQVIPAGTASGFDCEGVLINEQMFTKTANIWGVSNNAKGTNTNRVVLFRKTAGASAIG